MPITISVLYPNTPGSKFDMDYYLNTHIPLVKERWSSMGMSEVRAVKGVGTPDPDTPAPYQVIALLRFESMEAFQAAGAAHGGEIMGDIKNFTDTSPNLVINEDL